MSSRFVPAQNSLFRHQKEKEAENEGLILSGPSFVPGRCLRACQDEDDDDDDDDAEASGGTSAVLI